MPAVGEIVKVRNIELVPKSNDLPEGSNKSPEPLLDGPATSEHMLVTTTPTMHVRAAKALFDVIMHKVYSTVHCRQVFPRFVPATLI